MANVFDSKTIVIDTFSSDIDIANSAFGISNTPVYIRHLVFSDPTAADVIVLKNHRGEVVTEILASTTGESIGILQPTCSEGLKIVASDCTVTTGKLLIHLA